MNKRLICIILAFSMLFVFLLNIALSFWGYMQMASLVGKMSDKGFKITTGNDDTKLYTKSTAESSAYWVAVVHGLGIIWLIFVLVYAFSKKPKVNNRKWPYIVLIILITCGIGYEIWEVSRRNFTSFKFENWINSEQTWTSDQKNFIINDIWKAGGYNMSITIPLIMAIVLSTIYLILCVVQLVILSKHKNENDKLYSNEVVNFGKSLDQQKNVTNELP